MKTLLIVALLLLLVVGLLIGFCGNTPHTYAPDELSESPRNQRRVVENRYLRSLATDSAFEAAWVEFRVTPLTAALGDTSSTRELLLIAKPQGTMKASLDSGQVFVVVGSTGARAAYNYGYVEGTLCQDSTSFRLDVYPDHPRDFTRRLSSHTFRSADQ